VAATTSIHKPPELAPVIAVAAPDAGQTPFDIAPRDTELHTPFRSLYVYLTSGAIEVIPFVSGVTLSDRTVTVEAGENSSVEFARSSIYLMSRELISPPVLF
jgi:hypothetical protein